MSIEHRTLNQSIYRRMRELIVKGALPSGSRIDERAIAEEFGVSRTPLRDALTKLAEDGLVVQRPYRGRYVHAFTPKQANDLYETRKVLEGLAIRLAVKNLTDQRLAELKSILDEIADSLERDDMDAYADADQRFHTSVTKFADNEPLVACLDRLSLQIQLMRITANRDPGVIERTSRERPLILAALESRDAEQAGKLMEDHIDGVRQALVAKGSWIEKGGSD